MLLGLGINFGKHEHKKRLLTVPHLHRVCIVIMQAHFTWYDVATLVNNFLLLKAVDYCIVDTAVFKAVLLCWNLMKYSTEQRIFI